MRRPSVYLYMQNNKKGNSCGINFFVSSDTAHYAAPISIFLPLTEFQGTKTAPTRDSVARATAT